MKCVDGTLCTETSHHVMQAAVFAICISTVKDGFNNVSLNQQSNPRLELPVSAWTEWDTFTGPSKSTHLEELMVLTCEQSTDTIRVNAMLTTLIIVTFFHHSYFLSI